MHLSEILLGLILTGANCFTRSGALRFSLSCVDVDALFCRRLQATPHALHPHPASTPLCRLRLAVQDENDTENESLQSEVELSDAGIFGLSNDYLACAAAPSYSAMGTRDRTACYFLLHALMPLQGVIPHHMTILLL